MNGMKHSDLTPDFSIGDIVRYTGPIVGFGLGEIVDSFRNQTMVVVRLIEEIGTYADWPISQIELVEPWSPSR